MVERIDAAAHASVGAAFTAVDSAAIRVHRERCAKVRNRNVECLKCAAACTSGCIALVDGELVIDGSKCVGCGTCATVCPTCALEALNPSDAELANACATAARTLAARCRAAGAETADARRRGTAAVDAPCRPGAEPIGTLCRPVGASSCSPSASGTIAPEGASVVIACSLALEALGDLVDGARVAPVVCAGRVDESLLCGLAAAGVTEAVVLCGRCDRCAQRHGAATAALVAETTRTVLDAWGVPFSVTVTDEVPAAVLRFGVTAEAARARDAFFAGERACASIGTTGTEDVVPNAEATRAPGADSVGQGPCPCRSTEEEAAAPFLHVMKDGTLPHFVPDRRERLLDALAALGDPVQDRLTTRLWGTVVIDGTKCVSCRMCATFCPTGAIEKLDGSDGVFGVTHRPSDCVKCGSCRDICPAQAITVLDEVRTGALVGGEVHRYRMTPRPVSLTDNPHQILDTFRLDFSGDIFER